MCLHLLLLFLLVTTAATFSAAQVDDSTTFQSIADGETIISDGDTFEFGFFSPDASNKHYVWMWYKKTSNTTVVWVANWDFPFSASSDVLKITNLGILVLVDQDNTIWSSNASIPTQNPVAQLLDSGNLVVMDGKDHNVVLENFLWQSFDYPSDTLLSRMKLGSVRARNLPGGRPWLEHIAP